MSNSEFENTGEGEWEDRDFLVWREYDWQQYLKQIDKNISKFLTSYLKHKSHAQRIDRVATDMGWVLDDGQSEETSLEADSKPNIRFSQPNTKDILSSNNFQKEESNSENNSDDDHLSLSDDPFFDPSNKIDPYTLHQHPVYIVTRGLFIYIRKCWELYFQEDPKAITADQAWQLAFNMNESQFHSIMAVNAVDLADYNLAVCHFKNALSALNATFDVLNHLKNYYRVSYVETFKKETCMVLFDLRDVWLRVMKECREITASSEDLE